MPRKPINYSNTIIYKLCCNDVAITDIYVGHTTDFINRKRAHKSSCTNELDKAYNYYVYEFIRDHGDWTNWSMVEIERICCIDSNDALKHERRNIESLGATLNKQLPTRTLSEYYQDNRDELQKYREDHRAEKNEYNQKYREDNRAEINEYNQKYREENRDKINEHHKKYYEDHRAEILEKKKKYREEHRDELNERRRLQRKLKKANA